MKEIHFFYAPNVNSEQALPPEESAHAVRVLRMKEGDPLMATDGKGTFYQCTLTLASSKQCLVKIEKEEKVPLPWKGNVCLAVAPTKNMDRMEWLAEKATEIGVNQISFLNCRNSERHIIKTERIEKIVVAAAKQSRKSVMPSVDEMQDFKQFVAQPFEGDRFIAHCLVDPETLPSLADVVCADRDCCVLIGPEGDFSAEEVALAEAAGFRSVNLGRSRLRTETAALVAVHTLNLMKGKN